MDYVDDNPTADISYANPGGTLKGCKRNQNGNCIDDKKDDDTGKGGDLLASLPNDSYCIMDKGCQLSLTPTQVDDTLWRIRAAKYTVFAVGAVAGVLLGVLTGSALVAVIAIVAIIAIAQAAIGDKLDDDYDAIKDARNSQGNYIKGEKTNISILKDQFFLSRKASIQYSPNIPMQEITPVTIGILSDLTGIRIYKEMTGQE